MPIERTWTTNHRGGMEAVRIVGGTWAGVTIAPPRGHVRATQEDLRGVWLDGLAPDLLGARVLDLFAGSGALGLEAISRGAASADFVEKSLSAIHAIRSNLSRLRVEERTRVFERDVFVFLQGVGPLAYDLAFADPPCGSKLYDRLATFWHRRPFSRILSVEHAASEVLPGGGRRRIFGDLAITTYRAAGIRRPATDDTLPSDGPSGLPH